MKKLILVRPGHYSGSNLTSRGIEGMCSLREKLKEYFQVPYVLFCSDTDRARESAGHLIEGAGVAATEQCFFYSDDDNPVNSSGLYALMESTTEDVLIVVTHYEWANYFPQQLAGRDGWRLPVSHPSVIDKGEAIIIDLEGKTALHVQPTYTS